jgi:O-antigen ligase
MTMGTASLAGAAAAVLQLAGALKTAPPLAGLPFDLTAAAFAAMLPATTALAVTRRWRAERAIAVPVLAAALLGFWLVVAGGWSASRLVLGQKLPEVVLVAPAMLAAGLLVGADPAARRGLCGATLLIGFALAAVVGFGVASGWAPRGAAEAEAAKLQYQLAGLAMATAAALSAVRAVEAGGPLRALAWLGAVAALAAAATLPGGRTAILALGLGVALAPGLALLLAGRRAVAAGWAGLCLLAALCLGLLLLVRPELADGLRTIERLTGDGAGLEARLGLWEAALDWAGREAPLGLGTGGFTLAAGHGERRGLYPHNHALEALVEAGLPGLLLWLGAFGGAVAAAARLAPRVAPGRAARIAALVLPVALTVLVSTDLGNRMAWFALGLALSLGLHARPPEEAHV